MRKTILLTLLTLLTIPMFAAGVRIGNLYYNLNEANKTAVVTYELNKSNENYSYLKGNLDIPGTIEYHSEVYTVTSIGNYAFYGCSSLPSVTIPNSVTSIGIEAFYGCSGLTSVTIPNSVTKIGSEAFRGCSGLTSVTIGISVTEIGSYAFYGCLGLTSVTIPDSVTSIGNYAFNDCSGLTSVTIGNSVTSIGYYAFTGTGLTSVEFNAENCTTCGSYRQSAFPSKLSTLIIGNNVKIIPDYAFDYCSGLTNVTIPNSVTSIGRSAFGNCSGLTSVAIGNSVASIGENAFRECSSLTSVEFNAENCTTCGSSNYPAFPSNLSMLTIGNNVQIIPNYAFYGCSRLTSVTIPNSVTSIGNYAFTDCSDLTSVEFNAENCTTCGSSDQPAFPSNLSTLIIGNNVKIIPNYAFDGCSGLTNVTIPNSVTSIGYAAFAYCSGLTSVTIGISVTEIGSYAFYGCSGLTSVTIPNSATSIGYAAFAYCSGLTSVTIPNSVTSIGNYTFTGCSCLTSINVDPDNNAYASVDGVLFNKGLTQILIFPAGKEGSYIIPESVTSINEGAFYECSRLTSVTIGNSVTSIGSEAFYDCSLSELYLTSTTPQEYYSAFSDQYNSTVLIVPNESLIDYLASGWSNFNNIRNESGEKPEYYTDNIFKYAYVDSTAEAILVKDDYSSLTIATIPSRVPINGQFYNVSKIAYSAFDDCTSLTNVTIPNSVTSIGNYAFRGCSGLTSITIGAAVTSIGSYAFYGCSGLTSVTIPNSVTSIGNYAFRGCSGLTSVTIGAAVTSIGSYAFYGCTGLTSVTVPDSVTEIEPYTFYGCSSLTSVTIGNSVTSIGSSAFSGCSGLTNVTIPNSVTSIGYDAFYRCSGLTNVTIGNSVTSIGGYAFDGCSGLTNVTIPNSVTSIGNYAFRGCFNVENLIFEDGDDVLSLGGSFMIPPSNESLSLTYSYIGRTISGNFPYTYAKNTLTSLEIGPLVKNFEFLHFQNFTALKSVNFLSEVPISIGASAFEGCQALESAEFSGSVVEIGDRAFYGTALTEVIVPNATIGNEAFAGLNLNRIVLGANVENIGEKAFDGSNNLGGVYATAVEPPFAYTNTFSSYASPLYVLETSTDAYYNDINCWYRFDDYALVEPEIIELAQGQITTNTKGEKQLQLSVSVAPANTTLQNILWSSSDPRVATVDNNGLVTFHVNNMTVTQKAKAFEEVVECEITATTLYPDSPIATVKITGTATGIDVVVVDGNDSNADDGLNATNDIYNLQGVMIKANASKKDIDSLEPGFYIIGGKKVIVK